MKPPPPKDWCNTAIVIAVALGLAACGGGDAPVLRGTAATGAPLVDAQVSLVCASGPVLTTRTNTAGDWQLTLSAQRAPCAAQVNADPLANGLRYHALSASTDGGVLNITPLTDLVVTRLIGAEPTAWFATLPPQTLRLYPDSQRIKAAQTQVLDALGLQSIDAINFMGSAFKAKPGHLADDLLTALQAASQQTQTTHASLRTVFASANGQVSADFKSALTNAFFAPAGGGSELMTACNICRFNCQFDIDKWACLATCELLACAGQE